MRNSSLIFLICIGVSGCSESNKTEPMQTATSNTMQEYPIQIPRQRQIKGQEVISAHIVETDACPGKPGRYNHSINNDSAEPVDIILCRREFKPASNGGGTYTIKFFNQTLAPNSANPIGCNSKPDMPRDFEMDVAWADVPNGSFPQSITEPINALTLRKKGAVKLVTNSNRSKAMIVDYRFSDNQDVQRMTLGPGKDLALPATGNIYHAEYVNPYDFGSPNIQCVDASEVEPRK